MSHFTVTVVTKEPAVSHANFTMTKNWVSTDALNDALQPFHEYECTGEKDQYVEWVDETEEHIADFETTTIPAIFFEGEPVFTKYSDEAKRFFLRDGIGISSRDTFLLEDGHEYEGYTCQDVPAKEYFDDFRHFMEYWCGYGEDSFRGDKVGRFTNPNSRWDWWTVGGRWSDSLLLKDGSKTDSAQKKDIDFITPVNQARERATELFDNMNVLINGREFTTWTQAMAQNEDISVAREVYNDQAILEEMKTLADANWGFDPDPFFGDREEYIDNAGLLAISTYAFLIDGEWIEKGSMGWWGMSSNDDPEWENNIMDIIDNIDDDMYITTVDCHV